MFVTDAPVVSLVASSQVSNVSLSDGQRLIAIENSSLTVLCLVDAYPLVDRVTWFTDTTAALGGLSVILSVLFLAAS